MLALTIRLQGLLTRLGKIQEIMMSAVLEIILGRTPLRILLEAEIIRSEIIIVPIL